NTDVFKGQYRFVFAPGGFPAREGLEDVDVVVLHYWIGERLAVRDLDEAGRTVRFVRPSRMRLFEGHGQGPPQARYYVENASCSAWRAGPSRGGSSSTSPSAACPSRTASGGRRGTTRSASRRRSRSPARSGARASETAASRPAPSLTSAITRSS